ncbi:MAG: 3'-5' exonuclease [Verrucomicrobia bacterium]|jgi:DNA polymerase-3 subunit epsilon|nr:MAG: 3'-5' exonuclease [Verrucomicrobiota bacterium]
MGKLLIKEASLVAIDFESAGESPGETTYPIQVGMASMKELQLQPTLFFRSYLQIGRPVTWRAQQLHGISDHHLKEAPTMQALWPEFKKRLASRYLVAHGHGTERRFLRAFPMHGFGPWIDTLTLSREMIPGLPSYKLEDLITHFGLLEKLRKILPDFRWHEALSDALACLVLLLHLIQETELYEEPIEFLTRTRKKNC